MSTTTFFLVGSVLAASTQSIFSTKEEAHAFCPSGQLCDAGELAYNMQNHWMCPQYQATNPATHQQVICDGSGQWLRQTASPDDCQFSNEYKCHNKFNNCWNTPSSSCDNWCDCMNYDLGASNTANRLGSSLGVADDTAQLLGHGASCPWWLPQVWDQGTPGALGFSCYNTGLLCKYPSYGMNFVCGTNGVWQLQGPGPAPTPQMGTAPVAPQPDCPSYWVIWSGFTRCSRNGYLCRYPSHHKNFVCTNGHWQKQGNAPTPRPTPAPVNDFTCPSSSRYVHAGSFCTTKNQLCAYPNGEKWLCSSNGVWRRQY